MQTLPEEGEPCDVKDTSTPQPGDDAARAEMARLLLEGARRLLRERDQWPRSDGPGATAAPNARS